MSQVPIGDPRPAGEEGPAGDQREAGNGGPAGDPRPTGETAKGGTVSEDVAPTYDPSEHTVDEVNAHLADADPDEVDRIIAAERAGKDRSSIG